MNPTVDPFESWFPQVQGRQDCRWTQVDTYYVENEAEDDLLVGLDDDGYLTLTNGIPEDAAIYESHYFLAPQNCPSATQPATTPPSSTPSATPSTPASTPPVTPAPSTPAPPTKTRPSQTPTPPVSHQPSPSIGTPTSYDAPPVQPRTPTGPLASTGADPFLITIGALGAALLVAGLMALRRELRRRGDHA